MPDFKPLYRNSINVARESKQLSAWRESLAENKRCRDFLDDLIENNWDGMHLTGNIQQQAVDEFGYDRVMWVLANHMQHNEYDGRFSADNKIWSDGTYIPRPDKNELRHDPYLNDHSAAYLLYSHPDKVNELTDKVRELYNSLNMLDHRHRDPNDDDYKGKILILRANWLNENHKSPENQLFLADSGFGCDPAASGRAVFGQFLIDGEKARLERSDFVGVLDDQYLPDWVKEKLQQEQSAADAPDEGSQPVMKGM